MFGTIVFFIFLILGICEFLWYFTCTEHKEVPLILVLLDLLTVFCPMLNIIMFFANLVIFYGLIDDWIIELKDNWFNRVFLAHNAK